MQQSQMVETSTSINIARNVNMTKLGQSLHNKRIRVQGKEYMCTYSSNALRLGGLSLAEFRKKNQIKQKDLMTTVEVEIEEFGWVLLETFYHNMTDDVPAYLRDAKERLETLQISTVSQFHNHPLFAYKVKTDLITGKQIPLLRVCNVMPVEDDFRVTLSNDSLMRYIEQMCTHVKNGSRTAKLPFYSASTNTEVIRFYSCGFLRNVIWIDQSEISHRAFEIGGLPGRTLLGLTETSMLQNFADASEEVLIADCILKSHFRPLNVQFAKIQELFIDSTAAEFPSMRELLDEYNQSVLSDGVLKFEKKSATSRDISFVVKVGRCKGLGANNHVLNEFFTTMLYHAMGVAVPKTMLRACKITAGCGGEPPFDVYEGVIYYLIHEFIEGNSPNFEDVDHVKIVARGCFADVVLANFDVLGQNHLANLKVHEDKIYRIDCGAGLFTKHNGESKIDFAIDKRKLSDVRKDMLKYFSINTPEMKKVWSRMGSNGEVFFESAERCSHNFWARINKFKDNIRTNKLVPYFWDELLSLVATRLEVLRMIYKSNGDIKKQVWQWIKQKVTAIHANNASVEVNADNDADDIPLIEPSATTPNGLSRTRTRRDHELLSRVPFAPTEGSGHSSNTRVVDLSYPVGDNNEFKHFFPSFYFRVDSANRDFLRNEHFNHLYKEYLRSDEACQSSMEQWVYELEESTNARLQLTGAIVGGPFNSKWCHVKAIREILHEVMNRVSTMQYHSNSHLSRPTPAKVERKMNKITIQGAKSKVEESRFVINLTSNANDSQFRKLSPFQAFHDGALPAFSIPGVPNQRSYSVEGIWQGLKSIISDANPQGATEFSKFAIKNGKNLKRRRGTVLGHYAGPGRPLLSYVEARKQIYIPKYTEMLDKYCQQELNELFNRFLEHDLILLDYYKNEDPDNPLTPLSHASLVKARLIEMFNDNYIALPADDDSPATGSTNTGRRTNKKKRNSMGEAVEVASKDSSPSKRVKQQAITLTLEEVKEKIRTETLKKESKETLQNVAEELKLSTSGNKGDLVVRIERCLK